MGSKRAQGGNEQCDVPSKVPLIRALLNKYAFINMIVKVHLLKRSRITENVCLRMQCLNYSMNLIYFIV